MKIACIGWGSLIWNPGSLLIQREWFNDGPILPVEFVRQSQDGRLTLVLHKESTPVRTLWSMMATDQLEAAIESLRIREGISKGKKDSCIGIVTKEGMTNDELQLIIQQWIIQNDLDAAIYTDLPPKFGGEDNRAPSIAEAITYLQGLHINTFSLAREYVERTPNQVDTVYRRAFEKEFNWGNGK